MSNSPPNPIIFIQRGYDIEQVNKWISVLSSIFSQKSEHIYIVTRSNIILKDTKNQIIKYDTPIFSLSENSILRPLFFDYAHILYFDDTWIINDIDQIKQNILDIVAFKDYDKHDQIIFGEEQLKSTNSSYECNMKDQYKQMKTIFSDKKHDPYSKMESNTKNPSWLEYATKKFDSDMSPNFQLIPSIISTLKLRAILSNGINLSTSDHFINVFARELEPFDVAYMNFKIQTKPHTLIVQNNNGENTTIVTGFLNMNINRAPKNGKQKYDYIDKSTQTLSMNQNMVIFVSEELINHVISIRESLKLMDKTKIITVSEQDMFMYEHREKIFASIEKNIPPYNNQYLLMLVNSRYDYMLKAIEENYFKTDYFAWVDFSAGHIVEFPNKALNVQHCFEYSIADKIRIAWIARFNRDKTFGYNHLVMGGGIWIGHKDTLKEFIRLHNIEFRRLLDLGFVINDDRLIFFIFEKYPQLFDTYFSSYGLLLKKLGSNSCL
jgi:hypothetical protein